MTDTAHLAIAPASPAVDLRHLDGTLALLRRAERDVVAMAAYLAEARDAVAARPGDPEAARRITMAELRMRGDTLALAQDLAALARPKG